MTNRKLRKDLLQKLGITHQALSLRVQTIKKQHPMTTEDATYVVAHKANIPLDKYLDVETLDRIRGLLRHVSYPIQPGTLHGTIQKGKTVATKDQKVIQIASEFKLTDPILPQKKILEAKEMASIYPLLYVLENSIRELIDKIMTSRCGNGWFDSKAPRGLRDTVKKRMADEEKNSWHQRRGARPIDYLDLDQLRSLMRKIEKEVVPNIIPSLEWFDQLVDEVHKSRCVVCHMNPLDRLNIQAVKLRFSQWQKQTNAKRNLIRNVPS